MKIRSLLLGAVLAASLAGCTTGHDLPTVSRGTPTSDLEIVATSYYNCLSNAGIEVAMTTNYQGQLAIVQFTGNHHYLWRTPTGEGRDSEPPGWDSRTDPVEAKIIGDYVHTTGNPNELLVDGLDRSDEYRACLAQTGYDDDAAMGVRQWDPSELANFQEQADINNEWASCARENGWPDIHDVSVPADPSSGIPHILIPSIITEDQLR